MTSTADRIAELLDAAIDAVNEGDLPTAHRFAALVLREDATNREAGELLATSEQPDGQWGRMTILCCDLVGSTELSERHDPEQYWTLVRRYQQMCRGIIEQRYDGHIMTVKGDGFLAVFGYPTAHEDDSYRAVQCGVDLCTGMRELSQHAQQELGEALDLRVGVHRGLVFVDVDQDEVYGLAANVASRVEGLAAPGTVVMTDEVHRLVADRFEVAPGEPQTVKGVSSPVRPLTVVAERTERTDHAFTTPLVGRSPEMAVLRAAWVAARTGRDAQPGAVVIRGEPGIGKSRLAAAIGQEARHDGAVVVELVGSPLHQGVGFHAFQVFVEARCGIDPAMDAGERLNRLRDNLGSSGADPATAVPLLAPVLGLAPSAGYDPVASEGRKLNDDITAAAYEYLVAAFASGAGVLVVDDLHWVDESTNALVALLLQRGPGTLLVVFTSRDTTPPGVPTVLDLDPLDREACIELVAVLQSDVLPDAERDAIVDRSDGVPLYIEELVRSVEDELPAARIAAADSAVPEPLYELLVARLLQTGSREVAGAAATIGRNFDSGLLAAVLEIGPDELDRGLAALTAGGLVVPASRPGEAYRFRHELLRGVAYDLQIPSVRRRMHERIATVLLGVGSDEFVDWNLVAAHYELARRPAEAANAYAHAADRARRRGALAEARERLGRSIQLIGDVPDDRDRVSREVAFRLRRGFLATSAEGVGCPEAASDYERCLELALMDVYGDEMFSSLISLWAYHLSRAELHRARDVLMILRRSLAGDREWFRPANRAGFGMLSWFEGEFSVAGEALEDAAGAVADAEQGPTLDAYWFVPNDPATSIFTHLGLARFMVGDTTGADAAMAHSANRAAALDFPQGPWSAAYGAWLGSWMLAERGAFDRAASDVAQMIESSAEHGFDSWTMIGMTQQAAIETMRSLHDPDAGAQIWMQHATTLGEMVALWKSLELLLFLPFYLTVQGAAFAAAGDVDAAATAYQEAVELGERTGMRFYIAETMRRSAQLDRDADQTVGQLWKALALARAQSARPFELRIAADLVEIGGADAVPALEAAVAAMAPGTRSVDLDAARTRIAHS